MTIDFDTATHNEILNHFDNALDEAAEIIAETKLAERIAKDQKAILAYIEQDRPPFNELPDDIQQKMFAVDWANDYRRARGEV